MSAPTAERLARVEARLDHVVQAVDHMSPKVDILVAAAERQKGFVGGIVLVCSGVVAVVVAIWHWLVQK